MKKGTTPRTIVTEKAGKRLAVDYFETTTGSGVRYYVNDVLVEEKLFEGKSIHWAQSAAHHWLDAIKPLNG
jgi:hypothetical protein